MRIDQGNWRFFFEEAPVIYLNGCVMEDVVLADEEAGCVVIHERDLQGNLVIRGDQLVQRKITGRVSIEGKRRL